MLPRIRTLQRCSRTTARLDQRCPFSSSSYRRAYEDTIQNLKIGKNTKVIYQGFTGRVSTTNAQQSLEYGTKIVGGTTPGREGEHLAEADASAVFVAAHQAGKAIEDAIAAEIPLIVAVAEFIPLHDILRISQILNAQSKSRLVGANAPGIIAPLGTCRIGFQPLPCYLPGHVGMVAKSGTLSYEAVGSLTRAGVGQSICIGMGGDIVAGTNMVEALKLFEHDDDTQSIVVIGEVGGRAELDAAEWIKDYRRRTKDPKPIAACVGGMRAKPGRIMGHAGAFASLGEKPAEEKLKALKDAGAEVVDHPSQFGGLMRKLMDQSGRGSYLQKASAPAGGQQRRGYHTMQRRSFSTMRRPAQSAANPVPILQQRSLHFSNDQSKNLLKQYAVETSDTEPSSTEDQHFLAISVNRSDRCPCIIASPTTHPDQIYPRAKSFDYDYATGPDKATVEAVMKHLQLSSAPALAMASAGKLVNSLVSIFKDKEAYALSTHLSGTSEGSLHVHKAQFSFDNSAFKSGKRQQDIHGQRDITKEDPDELSVESEGIVYVKLDDPEASIGTLINGAGLAMNANDALTLRGAHPTNFLDTGGKATKETVKMSFEVILRDPRVKVIFVNIFGGLTLCDMIADGIMLAFKDLEMKIPVVVRLRGTNELEGQKMIAESGLPLHAYDDFTDAANKCKELANAAKSS